MPQYTFHGVVELRCRRHWASISLTRADIHPLSTGWVTNSKSVVGPKVGPIFGNFPPPGNPGRANRSRQLEGLAGHLGAGEAYSWGIRRTHEWHDARRSTRQPQGRSLRTLRRTRCKPMSFSDVTTTVTLKTVHCATSNFNVSIADWEKEKNTRRGRLVKTFLRLLQN